MTIIKHTIDDNKKENIADCKMESNIGNGVYYLKHQCIEIQGKCKKLLTDGKVYERFDSLMKFMISNPLLLVGFIFITAILIVPILLFTIFAIINVAIAFSSFIIIEVTLLMIGMTVLCCLLFLIITAVVIIGLTFILSFYVIYFSVTLVKTKLHCK